MATVAFFHAHPDDEAIFTGGTIVRLVQAGHTVAVVMATSGGLGRAADQPLDEVRSAELAESCSILGVHHVVSLGHADSGIAERLAIGSFATIDLDVVASQLADVLVNLGATELVGYDNGGIYGHPDHLQVHQVAHRAAARVGIETVYDATVDREYLHFVDTHLIDHAQESLPHAGPIGLPTVMISATVDVRAQLMAKRSAIASHRSQVAHTSSVMQLSPASFEGVYGFEWYVRHGPTGVIDALAEPW